jgi:hypothetical protein
MSYQQVNHGFTGTNSPFSEIYISIDDSRCPMDDLLDVFIHETPEDSRIKRFKVTVDGTKTSFYNRRINLDKLEKLLTDFLSRKLEFDFTLIFYNCHLISDTPRVFPYRHSEETNFSVVTKFENCCIRNFTFIQENSGDRTFIFHNACNMVECKFINFKLYNESNRQQGQFHRCKMNACEFSLYNDPPKDVNDFYSFRNNIEESLISSTTTEKQSKLYLVELRKILGSSIILFNGYRTIVECELDFQERSSEIVYNNLTFDTMGIKQLVQLLSHGNIGFNKKIDPISKETMSSYSWHYTDGKIKFSGMEYK